MLRSNYANNASSLETLKKVCKKKMFLSYYKISILTGPCSAVGTCLATDACLTASRGREFDSGLVPYFRGD